MIDYLVYLALRVVVCLLQSLTMAQCRQLAAAISRLAYHVNRRHREVAVENLRWAFPGRYSEEELGGIVQRVYRHFALMIAEMAHVPRKMHHSNWRSYLTLHGVEPVIESLLRREPVIMLSGHFGNWEMAGYVFGVYGFRTYLVARPLDNPYLERFLQRFRRSCGQKLIPKKGGLEQADRVLQQRSGIMALLGDQDAGRHGVFVEYFGRPASTHKAIALLALRHGATMVTGGARRLGGRFHYEMSVADLFRATELAQVSDPIRAVTRRFTSSLERVVRQAPEQYLWLHRRWKTQPGHRRRLSRRRAAASHASPGIPQ